MKQIFFIVLVLSGFVMAQQMNHTWGTNLAGEDYAGGLGTFIDTTAGTTNYIYVDLDDYYFIDPGPLVIDYDMDLGSGEDSTLDGTVKNNSDRMYLGTFYVSFDNQGAAPTADSLGGYFINVTPGIYTTENRSLALADWGTAVTLETIRVIGDYFAVNNAYIHASKYKLFPPQVIRLGINAPSSNKGMDDSTMVYWDFSYPGIYHVHEVQK